jgi:hypothetical protein
VIEVVDLRKRYGTTTAVDGLTLRRSDVSGPSRAGAALYTAAFFAAGTALLSRRDV